MRFQPRVRRKPVGLTSLIDVIFLLLLFFMLASSFSRYQAMPIAGGVTGGGADAKPAYLRIHARDRIDLNGAPVLLPDLAGRFGALLSAETRVVAIWSGPGARVQDVVDVMAAARGEGLDTVIITGN